MGTYRLEEAPSARAGCQNAECKNNKVKIQKGELRVGTWIENEKFQSFMWRHWGCVTPKLISNIVQSLEEAELEMGEIDGFDELSEENQGKVLKAAEQGHVEDEDWNGDVEMNRPGKNGFRVRGGAKKKGGKAEAAESEGEDKDKEEKPKGKQTKSKKRTAKADEEEDEEAQAPAKKPKRATRPKKAASPGSDEGESANEEEEKPAKKSRASKSSKTERPARGQKKAAGAYAEDVNKDDGSGGEDGEDVEEKPKPRRGRKRAAKSG